MKGYNKDGTPMVPPTKKSKGESATIAPKLHYAAVMAIRNQKNQARYLELLVMKDQLQGLFTRRELTGMVDAFNGLLIEYPLIMPARDMVLAQMEDAVTLEANDKKHRYGAGELLDKLRVLTDIQAENLVLALIWFWDSKICSGDLNVFLDTFSPVYPYPETRTDGRE